MVKKTVTSLIAAVITALGALPVCSQSASVKLPEGSPIATDGSARPWDTSSISDPEVIVSIGEEGMHPAALAIRDSLARYIKGKDARFGIAVILEGNDTISVNGHKPFPMSSVYKFPQALALAEYCRKHNISFSDSIDIPAYRLLPDTWSPMRDRYGAKDLRLPISEVLAYSLQQSDNNACDILFTFMQGPEKVDSLMQSWGFKEIRVLNTEKEMKIHPAFGYSNTSSPIAMAALMDEFDTKHCLGSSEMAEIARLIENCETGKDRLVAALSKDAVCGHKTGTGPLLPNGRIMTINDCGYIRRIDGRRYTIAVFISESGYDMAKTESMIRDISRIVRNELKRVAD